MSEINLREAEEKDVKLLFDWANENLVRQNAINKEKIDWDSHQKWYKEKLVNLGSYIFILEKDKETLGQIRFDKIENHFEIDYSIDANHRGKGFGNEIVKKGIQKFYKKNQEKLVAKIKYNNISSIKVFEKNDFLLMSEEKNKEETFLIFELNKPINTIILLSEKKWNVETSKNLKRQLPNYNWIIINKKEDFTFENLQKVNPMFIFIPHWSYIIPENIFLNYNCIVFHMTDLPYGRGGSPLQNLISNGLNKTKISALKVVKELDAGPIFLKNELSLFGTAEEIFIRANVIIEKMIFEIINSNLQPKKQIGKPTFFKRRTPKMSVINEISDINKLFSHIRMLDAEGYPNAYFENENFKFEITRASIKANETILADVRIIKK